MVQPQQRNIIKSNDTWQINADANTFQYGDRSHSTASVLQFYISVVRFAVASLHRIHFRGQRNAKNGRMPFKSNALKEKAFHSVALKRHIANTDKKTATQIRISNEIDKCNLCVPDLFLPFEQNQPKGKKPYRNHFEKMHIISFISNELLLLSIRVFE